LEKDMLVEVDEDLGAEMNWEKHKMKIENEMMTRRE
jgi:hypothetical protein